MPFKNYAASFLKTFAYALDNNKKNGDSKYVSINNTILRSYHQFIQMK